MNWQELDKATQQQPWLQTSKYFYLFKQSLLLFIQQRIKAGSVDIFPNRLASNFQR